MNREVSEIMIIGASILDVLVRPASEEAFRTGSYAAEDIRMSVGADALNEATVLAALGSNVRLETVLGYDHAGDFIAEHCRKKGITLLDKCRRKNLKTGINVVLVKEDGSRSFLTNANGSLRTLRLEDIEMPFSKEGKIISFASIFVFPHIGVIELKQLFSEAKKAGKIVCADMTKCKNGETAKDMAEALAYVDYLFPNDEEAMLLTGETSVEKAADRLFETGVKHVIIKGGKNGCYVKTKSINTWVPAVEGVDCIDTTGAGDSFVAGFLHMLAKEKDVMECAAFANECGAKAVQRIGAVSWIER